MNHLLVLIRTLTHLIYKMIYRFHLKLSNLKKHPTTNENNRENIKNSKYASVSFNGIPEENQPKYIDFLKTLFGKPSQSFSSKWYKEFPSLHYNLDKDAAFCYTSMSASAEINGLKIIYIIKMKHL